MKPDRRIFEIALKRARLPAEAAAHVGDIYWYDVKGAEAAGFTPILLDPYCRPTPQPCLRIASLGELPALLGV